MAVKKSGKLAALIALSVGVGSVPAAAHNDGLEIFTMIYLASEMAVMGTYMGLISSAVATGTHDYVQKMNEEQRREADAEINRVYHSDGEILYASSQADLKIKENQEMLKSPQAKNNEALQKQCRKNMHLWQRIKERGEIIKKQQAAQSAQQFGQSQGLNIGS